MGPHNGRGVPGSSRRTLFLDPKEERMGQQAIRSTAMVVFFLLALSAEGFPGTLTLEESVGKDAPDFTLKDLNGKDVSLVDFRGKVILLNFWATWCPPCITEMVKLEELKQALQGEDFEILAVSTDRSLSRVKKFVGRHPVSFVVLHDSDIKVSRKYNVFSLPTTFLIDGKGRIVEKFLGEFDWTSPEIRKKIHDLL